MTAARASRRDLARMAGIVLLVAASRVCAGCWQTDLAGVVAAGAGGGSTCEPPASACGTACAIVSEDPANCGACGHTCASGEVCSESACAPACAAGLTDCAGACVAGACSCPSGSVDCSGVCVDTRVSPLHCGECGKVCPPSKTCVAGACT